MKRLMMAAAVAVTFAAAVPRVAVATDLFATAAAAFPTSECSGPVYYSGGPLPLWYMLCTPTADKTFYMDGFFYPNSVSNHTAAWNWQINFIQSAGSTGQHTDFYVYAAVVKQGQEFFLGSPVLSRIGQTSAVAVTTDTDSDAGFGNWTASSSGSVGITDVNGAACDSGCRGRPIVLRVVVASTSTNVGAVRTTSLLLLAP